MIEDFVDSSIIIDDKKEEIIELEKLLIEKDIWVQHYSPNELTGKKFRNRKIIFLDLSLDDSQSIIANISMIRRILTENLGKEFGTYGIILWTNHEKHVGDFIDRIKNDRDNYSLPLFVVGLDKGKYLHAGNYKTLLADLNEIISKSFAAKFFIKWFTLVNKGKDQAITSVYSLIKDYSLQDSNLFYLMFQLGKSYTGMDIQEILNYSWDIDTIKVLNTLMNYDIANSARPDPSLTKSPAEIVFLSDDKEYKISADVKFYYQNKLVDDSIKGEKEKHDPKKGNLNSQIIKAYSKINFKLMIDDNNIDTGKVIPGNVYSILDKTDPFITDSPIIDSEPIIIEITPRCDYSQGKNPAPKVLSGFITTYSKEKYKSLNKDYLYKEIWPLCFNDKEELKMIFFDFRYTGLMKIDELKNESKYKLLFRVQEKLFADILQKYSAYNARLGLSILH